MAQVLVLISQHSLGLVLAAAVVCTLMAGLVVPLVERTRTVAGRRRVAWMIAIALLAGVGVWTTHFVAMLGFRPDMMFGYEPILTLLSGALAIVAVGLPWACAATARVGIGSAVWGALGGLGVGAMHFTGMAALQGCAASHSAGTTIASLGLGSAFGALALGARPIGWRSPASTLLLVLAVCSLHFTAVGGVRLAPEPLDASAWTFHPMLMGVLVSMAALTMLGAALALAWGQIRLERREQIETARLAEKSRLLETALHNMSNGLLMLGADERIELFNRRLADLLHLAEEEIAVGMPLEEFLANVGRHRGCDEAWVSRAAANHRAWMRQDEIVRLEQNFANGDVLSIACRPHQGGLTLTFDDVTGEREHQMRMAYLAHHDALTGLGNRRAFRARMETALAEGQDVDLLLLDLDRFKEINDTLGHSAGDALLVEFAERLRRICRSGEFLARLGGDELAILRQGGTEDGAEVLAEEIIAALRTAFDVNGTQLSVSCSIGIADGRSATGDPEVILQQADLALYKAKAGGRGISRRFEPAMAEEAELHRRLERDIAIALEQNQFTLFYQPLLSVLDGRVIGFEALIRWKHPDRGYVSPAEFIPVAEQSGQIEALGSWVLEQACRDAASWPNECHVAVNVSPIQLRSPAFLAQVVRALDRNGLVPSRLEMELTETALVEDGPTIAGRLSALRELGVKVAMDDFGTGYSSLAHLREFKLDRIKIDRSFVAAAPTDKGSMAVVRAVTQMAKELGVTTVGEGVETAEQMEILRLLGCDVGQGYLLGRPCPAAEAAALVGTRVATGPGQVAA